VINELFDRYDALGEGTPARSIAHLTLERLPEVGKYFFRDEVLSLPVEEDHALHDTWQRFEDEHGNLGPQIVALLTSDPFDPSTLGSVNSLLKKYGRHISAQGFLNTLEWMPENLREIIAIHTLNAGISPERTLALYATMPAVMAREGIFVPEGGVYEIALALSRLAEEAGATIHTNMNVTAIRPHLVETQEGNFDAEYIVGAADTHVIDALMGKTIPKHQRVSCSGIAVFAVLDKPLPAEVVTHSVIMPSDPAALHASLDDRQLPEETMAFLNYYKPGHIYPNKKATAAILLTAPADGKKYGLEHPFVQKELARISQLMGFKRPLVEYIAEHHILHPQYFAEFGATGGALYGATRKLWQSGPFHKPGYSSLRTPWLWRVGASVHPGGGIPAVIGGAMNSMGRLLKKI
jgi:phytoene desaturase